MNAIERPTFGVTLKYGAARSRKRASNDSSGVRGYGVGGRGWPSRPQPAAHSNESSSKLRREITAHARTGRLQRAERRPALPPVTHPLPPHPQAALPPIFSRPPLRLCHPSPLTAKTTTARKGSVF